MLPQKCSAAFSSTRQIAQNRECKLLQWRARLYDPFQAWDNAGLCSFLLTGLVQATESITCLENMVGNFLAPKQAEFCNPLKFEKISLQYCGSQMIARLECV